MKSSLFAIMLVCAAPATAAVVFHPSYTIDWLTYAAGSSSFSKGDGSMVANVVLGITEGSALPGALSPLDLDAAYWSSEVPFDSGGNPASAVESLRVHVFPGPTSTVFSLTFGAITGNFNGAILALGGLDAGTTSLLRVSGSHSSLGPSSAPFTYLGDSAWNPGFGALDQAFAWSESNGTITPSGGTGGETSFAFLQMPGSGIDTVTIEFTSTAPGPFGDAFVAALGAVTVPEPGTPLLLLAAGAIAFSRRRRTFASS